MTCLADAAWLFVVWTWSSQLHDLERRLTNNINNMLEDNLLAQLGEIASASDISNLKNYTQDALEGLSQGMSNVQETLTDVLKLLKELKQNNSSSSSSTKKPLESLSLTENVSRPSMYSLYRHLFPSLLSSAYSIALNQPFCLFPFSHLSALWMY